MKSSSGSFLIGLSIASACLFMLISPSQGHAEGRCPPGQYPIGGQGVGGCTPPVGTSSSSGGARPSGKWHTKWGSFAVSDNGVGAAVSSMRTKREAERRVVQDCESGGGMGCRSIFTYKNACAAVAYDEPSSGYIFYSRPTVELAVDAINEHCKGGRGYQCEVLNTYCSLPEFERYF